MRGLVEDPTGDLRRQVLETLRCTDPGAENIQRNRISERCRLTDLDSVGARCVCEVGEEVATPDCSVVAEAAWFAQRVKGARQNTKHRVSKEARHFLGWAYKQGLTPLDLSDAIDSYPTGSGRLDWLTWDEVDQLLAAIPKEHLRFACEWLFLTGCRVGEAISATQADVRQRDDAGMYEW